MGKITSLVLPPGSGKTPADFIPREKGQDEPSNETINNILNYSKALKVEKSSKGKDFIEYIAN